MEERYDIRSRELTELIAYERLHPGLEQRLDYLFGLLCAVIVNTAPGKKPKKYKPVDFIPQWGGPRPGTTAEIKNLFRGLGS